MVYHQVARSVVRKESGLKAHHGVVMIKSVDGLGHPGPKINTYKVVNTSTPKYVHAGFKLFFTEDRRNGGRLMTPQEVLGLKPRPEYVMSSSPCCPQSGRFRLRQNSRHDQSIPWLTGDPEADALLSDDNALLIGMVLDQQVPMEKAFSGPLVIAQRMGGRLDVTEIAAMSEDEFIELCSQRPAIHRFPAAMAKRVRQVCQVLTEDYDGQATNVWKDARSGAEVKANLGRLPGFGPGQGSHLHRGARQAAGCHARGLAYPRRLLR